MASMGSNIEAPQTARRGSPADGAAGRRSRRGSAPAGCSWSLLDRDGASIYHDTGAPAVLSQNSRCRCCRSPGLRRRVRPELRRVGQ